MVARYREARDSRGMTDYQVAKKAGIPKSTLYDWLRRARKNPEKDAGMTPAHVVAIARALSVDPVELLRG